jgi:putative transposase
MDGKTVRKSFKFRIYPTKAQVEKLEMTLDLCRELYNAALQERRDAWRLNCININRFEQDKQLPDIKQTNPEYKDIYSNILQDVLKQLDKTFRDFFRRVKQKNKAGFPRFKGKSRFNSFTYKQKGFSLTDNKLDLSKIGKLKIKLSRPVIGKVKTCTIKREIDKWFVIFSVETAAETLPKTGKQIGVDVGIENFLTLSDGTQIENFKFYKNSQKKLRVAQRSVARKAKGSNSRKKALLRLRKIHQKIKNQRADFQHKITTRLIKEFDLIAIEKLQIRNMVKNHHLAKSISDVAWNNSFLMLKYKAENAGKSVIEVNPSGTSQTCICGETVKKDLSIRWHKCDACGLSEHRDIVSAQVILQRAGLVLLAQTETVRL